VAVEQLVRDHQHDELLSMALILYNLIIKVTECWFAISSF
jgi:hypothetical protein